MVYRIFVMALCMAIFGVPLSADSLTVPAKGRGMSDDSAIIQQALDRCAAARGGTVTLLSGKYRLGQPIRIPSGVTLKGDWAGPHPSLLDKGTVILAYAGKGKEDGPPLIALMPNSAIKGLTIYYPEQKLPAPDPYPWTIRGQGADCSVMDITLVNSYNAIDFDTYPNERHYIRNLFGCMLRKGIYVDKSVNGRIENVHFSHNYWTRARANVPQTYWDPLFADSYLNSTAFRFGHAENEYVMNTFAIACKIGYHFVKTKDGACSGNFLGIGMDFTQKPLLIEETQDSGILITNGEFVAGNGVHTEAQLEVAPTFTGVAQFANCAFWGPVVSIARIAGTGMVSMSQCNLALFTWDQPSGKPAIEVAGGSLTLINSHLFPGWDRISLGPQVESAVIMGNIVKGPLTIDNQSKGDVQIVGNISQKK